MKMSIISFFFISALCLPLASCLEVHNEDNSDDITETVPITNEGAYLPADSYISDIDTHLATAANKNSYKVPTATTGNRSALRTELVAFAKKYIGTKYAYACSTPEAGFDCSGFINYVYNHFKFEVPRSSKDFEHVGRNVPVSNLKKGDLVLFTGTDPSSRQIGHIGIIIEPAGMNSEFIHSSSGSANGVTISSLDEPHYTRRFVKVVDIIN